MKTKKLKRHLILFLMCFSFHANAQEYKWFLVTDKEQMIEMSRVCSFVATDTEETFSILDSNGNILAKGVSKATFAKKDPAGIKKFTSHDNILENFVNNTLTLIGVEGNVEIFSANGMKVLSAKATKGETHINVSHFTPGVYLVKCRKQSFKFTKK